MSRMRGKSLWDREVPYDELHLACEWYFYLAEMAEAEPLEPQHKNNVMAIRAYMAKHPDELLAMEVIFPLIFSLPPIPVLPPENELKDQTDGSTNA